MDNATPSLTATPTQNKQKYCKDNKYASQQQAIINL